MPHGEFSGNTADRPVHLPANICGGNPFWMLISPYSQIQQRQMRAARDIRYDGKSCASDEYNISIQHLKISNSSKYRNTACIFYCFLLFNPYYEFPYNER
ncbi:MAG: hypothetical protein AB7S75_13620 [Desulfococcaceae bacterium]